MNSEQPDPITNLSLRAVNSSDTHLLDQLNQRQDVRDFIGSVAHPAPGGGEHLFTILENLEPVGVAGLVRSTAFDRADVEVICALLQSAEGKLLASKACSELVAWARRTRSWQRLLASVHDKNPRSRKLVDRLGFKFLVRREWRNEDLFELNLGAA